MSGIASAIVGVVGLGYSAYKGIKAGKDAKKAKQEEESMKHPFYKVQDEYYQDRNIAEQQASGGLPQGVKDYEDTERKRGLNSSLEALQNGSSDPAIFARLMGGYNESLGQEASADAQAHVNNIQYFMGANKDVAGQKNIGFGLNELQPYEDKLKQITQRRAADEENLNNSISEGLGTAASLAGSLSSSGYMDKLFGKSDPYGDKSYFAKFNNFKPEKAGAVESVSQPAASPADRYSTITDKPSNLLGDQDSNISDAQQYE